MTPDKHYVYIAECADGTLYTGYTVDIAGREEAHNSGKGAKYTRSRRPVTMVYAAVFSTKSEAAKREAAIKLLRRAEKQKLIHGESNLIALLFRPAHEVHES
jgi:putative endonuclease